MKTLVRVGGEDSAGDVMGKPPGPGFSSERPSWRSLFGICQRAERTVARRFASPPPAFRSDESKGASCSEMMPTKTPRKPALQNSAPSECSAAIALQLRKIGDKWDLRQRILNLISKLFSPGT